MILALGITLTPGVFRYAIVNEDVETCKRLTPVGGEIVTQVDLVPVPDEQCVDVQAGDDMWLGLIGGMDAQVIFRAGGLASVPARINVSRREGPQRYKGDPKVWASVTLAIEIDATTIPREAVAEGCARTPGAYAQHVQGCHKYTATLRRLCPEAIAHARANLRTAEGGFLVTIENADVGTVLTRDAAYAAANVRGSLEVDALIVKRQGKARGYSLHLAVELARPGPARPNATRS